MAAGTGQFSSGSNSRRIIVIVVAVVVVLAIVIGLAVGLTRPDDNNNKTERQTVSALERAKKLLDEFPVVDGHNDLPWQLRISFNGSLTAVDLTTIIKDHPGLADPVDSPSHTDIPRLRAGKVGGQFWSVFAFCQSEYKDGVKKAVQQFGLIHRFTQKYSDVFELVTEADDIAKANSRNHIASMIGLEGGHYIENDLDILRMYYDLGARYMTLTWSCDITWADSYLATRNNRSVHGGLSAWGERVVKEMNRLGMMVDLSHVGFSTMEDAIRVSFAPVIFSHSSAFAICPNHRNVPDNILLKLKDNGGIIMLNLFTGYINCTAEDAYDYVGKTASIDQVLEHMDHIKTLIGVDHIGIGADYDGVSSVVTGLEDVSTYPKLFAAMLSAGWSDEDIKKVSSQNIVRVMKAVEKVRDDNVDMAIDETPFTDPLPPGANNCTTFWKY